MDGPQGQITALFGVLQQRCQSFPLADEGHAEAAGVIAGGRRLRQGPAVGLQVQGGDVKALQRIRQRLHRQVADQGVEQPQATAQLPGLRSALDHIHGGGLVDEAEAAPEPAGLAAVPGLVAAQGADQLGMLPAAVAQGRMPLLVLQVGHQLLQVVHHQLRALEHGRVDALQHAQAASTADQIGVVDVAAAQGPDLGHTTLPVEGLRHPQQLGVDSDDHACSACCCSISRSS